MLPYKMKATRDKLDTCGAVPAPFADTIVTAGAEDAGAKGTELVKHFTYSLWILQRDVLLEITIRNTDHPRDFFLRRNEQVVKPFRPHVAFTWSVCTMFYLPLTADAVEDVG